MHESETTMDKPRDKNNNGKAEILQYLSPAARSLPKHGGHLKADGDHGAGARVGEDFQAVLPDCSPAQMRSPEEDGDKSTLLWAPGMVHEEEMDRFILKASTEHNLNIEQALTLLILNQCDTEKALKDMADFAPIPTEWTVEDKLHFERALQLEGQSFTFRKIQAWLPEKSISSLVEYYYYQTEKRRGKKSSSGHRVVDSETHGMTTVSTDAGKHHEDVQDAHDGATKGEDDLFPSFVSNKTWGGDLYEEYCDENHSDERRETNTCPVCVKKVLYKLFEL